MEGGEGQVDHPRHVLGGDLEPVDHTPMRYWADEQRERDVEIQFGAHLAPQLSQPKDGPQRPTAFFENLIHQLSYGWVSIPGVDQHR